jgi:peptide/nickel transport system permease protein
MTIAAPALPAVKTRQPSIFGDFCRQQPLGAVSFVVIFAMMFAGIFSPLVAPYDPLEIDFASLLGAPSWEHWCGTDAFGRDICSRLIYGSRTALVIGFTSSFAGSSIGAILGIASAHFGGKIDDTRPKNAPDVWATISCTMCWNERNFFAITNRR